MKLRRHTYRERLLAACCATPRSRREIEQFFSHRGWPFVDERRIQQHLADLTELGLLARSGIMRHGYRYTLTPAGEAALEAAWAAEGR